MANIKISSVEQDSSGSFSISCYISGLDSKYSYTRTVVWYLDSAEYGTSTIPANTSSGGFFTFLNLEPETDYYIEAKIILSDTGNEVWVPGITQSTGEHVTPGPGPQPTTVDYWDWEASNGSASASATKNAYTAITTGGETTSFSHLVWNDMCDKIGEIRNAMGMDYGWTNRDGNYSETVMNKNDTVLTAARFNALRLNIDDAVGWANSEYGASISKTGYNKTYKGETVYGSYFIRLADKMNEIIEAVL